MDVDVDATSDRWRTSNGRRQVPNASGHEGPAGFVYVDTNGWPQGNGPVDLVAMDAFTRPILVLSLSAEEQFKDYVSVDSISCGFHHLAMQDDDR